MARAAFRVSHLVNNWFKIWNRRHPLIRPQEVMVQAPRKKCTFLAAVDWAWAPPRYVGVDLPQMALNRQLDNVFGHDDEIRSALRTLLGRRFQHSNSKCCTVSTTCTRRIKWRIVHIKYRREFDLSLQTCPTGTVDYSIA
jgi:hypothetical protein